MPRFRSLNCEKLESRCMLSIGMAVADYQFLTHGLDGATELFSRDTHEDSVASDLSSPLLLGSTGNGQPPRGLLLNNEFNETSEVLPSSRKDDYIEFTITPQSSASLDLALFTFQLRRSDANAKDAYAIYFDESSTGGDNFTSVLDIGQFDSVGEFETVEVSLRNRPELTNLTTAVTFRIYIWGTQGTGALRLDNIRVHEASGAIEGSSYAYSSESGRLIQPLDELGNRVADFSAAGYKYGEEPLPDTDTLFAAGRIVTVAPGSGDDTSRIQNAINQVSSFSMLGNGFRGMVQLTAGEYQTNSQIEIMASGVVLRGVGDGASAADSTILRGTGTTQRSLVVIGTGQDPSAISSTGQDILDKYVPVGATSFTVASTRQFTVGAEIMIERPSTANWITAIGMDQIPPKTNGTTGLVQWQAGDRDIFYERVVTRVEGNRVFVNAPLMNALDQQYGGGRVYRLNDPRISNIGVESIRGKSDFASDTDENHARTFIQVRSAKDVWIREITGQHFIYATVHADREAKAVTVQDARSLEPKSLITGGRRYPFNIEGQFILMRDLYSEQGRHDFVNNVSQRNHGPNVFLNGVSVDARENSGPHQRWATGTLYDTLITDDEFEAIDGGNAGSGHGWRGANMVFWNVTATGAGLRMQNPPTAQNWFIGATGNFVKDTRSGIQEAANMDSRNQAIDFNDPTNPLNSLYVAQRNLADDDAAADLERREYVLGDYDLGVADGGTSVDALPADSAWIAMVDAATTLPVLSSSDGTDVNGVLPVSFQPFLASDEAVVAAVMTLGLRNLDDDLTGELWLDSVNDRRTLRSLGALEEMTFNRTQTVTIELVGTDLQKLSDGVLNMAVTDAVVDWINVQLVVGDPPIAGDYNQDGDVNAADLALWQDSYSPSQDPLADGDQDGDVDGNDFLIWQRAYEAITPLTTAAHSHAHDELVNDQALVNLLSTDSTITQTEEISGKQEQGLWLAVRVAAVSSIAVPSNDRSPMIELSAESANPVVERSLLTFDGNLQTDNASEEAGDALRSLTDLNLPDNSASDPEDLRKALEEGFKERLADELLLLAWR